MSFRDFEGGYIICTFANKPIHPPRFAETDLHSSRNNGSSGTVGGSQVILDGWNHKK